MLAGPRLAVLRALIIVQDQGPSLALIINIPKCEVFSRSDISSFPPAMKCSNSPNLVILGILIGDQAFCSAFIQGSMGRLKLCCCNLKKLDQLIHMLHFHFFINLQVSARWLTLPVVFHPPKLCLPIRALTLISAVASHIALQLTYLIRPGSRQSIP